MTNQDGYLVIADIKGYTAYLTKVELDHAEGIMKSLFESIVNEMQNPLVISKLEGDAIFAYAPDGSFVQGQTLLEAIENMYCAFSKNLDTMHLNTTCQCNACKLMTDLDLKFILHHGTYILSEIAGRQELSGPDVILTHRLLKNDIAETKGIEAYAFISQSCADALNLGELINGMQEHSETYEHLGEINGYVHNLQSVWEHECETRHVYIDPDNSWFKVEVEVPVQPALTWDYLSDPQLRSNWLQADDMTVKENASEGRLGIGSEYHCAHGDNMVTQTIVDWKPFDYMTFDVAISEEDRFRLTTQLTPIESGTRVSWFFFKEGGSELIQKVISSEKSSQMEGMLSDFFSKGSLILREMIEKDLKEGKISN